MPIEIPPQFLTRPNASKQFKRSQRQLERDLDDAYKSGDEEVLHYYKLLTSDGTVRSAKDVDTRLVKQLQTDGLVPTWIVELDYLERRFGRRDTKQDDYRNQTGHDEFSTVVETQSPTYNQTILLPDDIPFLKSRIKQLEQEKHKVEREREAERKRQDGTIERLFAEIDVKNQQISAWDEVTQSLTKGLATGMIKPDPNAQALLVKPRRASDPNGDGARIVTEPVHDNITDVESKTPTATDDTVVPNRTKVGQRKSSSKGSAKNSKSNKTGRTGVRSKSAASKKSSASARKTTKPRGRPGKQRAKQEGFLQKHLPTFFANKK